jgi:hypothetical protein
VILQTGFTAQVETILTLIGTVDRERARKAGSMSAMAIGYRRFLSKLDQRPVSVATATPDFIDDSARGDPLRALFVSPDPTAETVRSAAHSAANADATAAHCKAQKKAVAEALEYLAVKSPLHHAMFMTVITDILIRPLAVVRASSTAKAIGLVWLGAENDYGAKDMAEMLVHGLTHQAMFLDELRHSHFDYTRMTEADGRADSAILGVPRPLDQVLHSIVVATELILFRDRCVGHPVAPRVHPPSIVLAARVAHSIRSLEAALARTPEVFRHRAYALIDQARDTVGELAARESLGGGLPVGPLQLRR